MTVNPDAFQYFCVPCRTDGRSQRATNRRVVRDQVLADFINGRHGTAVRRGSAFAVCVEHLDFLVRERALQPPR